MVISHTPYPNALSRASSSSFRNLKDPGDKGRKAKNPIDQAKIRIQLQVTVELRTSLWANWWHKNYKFAHFSYSIHIASLFLTLCEIDAEYYSKVVISVDKRTKISCCNESQMSIKYCTNQRFKDSIILQEFHLCKWWKETVSFCSFEKIRIQTSMFSGTFQLV